MELTTNTDHGHLGRHRDDKGQKGLPSYTGSYEQSMFSIQRAQRLNVNFERMSNVASFGLPSSQNTHIQLLKRSRKALEGKNPQ